MVINTEFFDIVNVKHVEKSEEKMIAVTQVHSNDNAHLSAVMTTVGKGGQQANWGNDNKVWVSFEVLAHIEKGKHQVLFECV